VIYTLQSVKFKRFSGIYRPYLQEIIMKKGRYIPEDTIRRSHRWRISNPESVKLFLYLIKHHAMKPME
jgi:hypothetical protein